MREYSDAEIRAEIYDIATGLQRQEQRSRSNGKWKQSAATNPIKIIPFNEIRIDADHRPYRVKGLIPTEGLTVIWGPPKSGKTFAAFDICMHVALGWEYRGRRVQQGAVVYCSFEGQAGLASRMEAYRQKHLTEDAADVPFYAQTMSLNLVVQVGDLIDAIKTAGVHPAVVTLDTLNRSLQGSESNDGDMGAYIKASDAIREAFGCAVIIIHHCGIDGTRPRGHTSLTGAADAQLACRRDRNENVELKVEWMKDGDSEGQTVASRLERVEVGVDADGDPITSCVVVPAEAVAMPERGLKLTKNQETMHGLLREAMPGGLMTEEWNAKAREEGIGVKRRSDLGDLRRALKEKGLVTHMRIAGLSRNRLGSGDVTMSRTVPFYRER